MDLIAYAMSDDQPEQGRYRFPCDKDPTATVLSASPSAPPSIPHVSNPSPIQHSPQWRSDCGVGQDGCART